MENFLSKYHFSSRFSSRNSFGGIDEAGHVPVAVVAHLVAVVNDEHTDAIAILKIGQKFRREEEILRALVVDGRGHQHVENFPEKLTLGVRIYCKKASLLNSLCSAPD